MRNNSEDYHRTHPSKLTDYLYLAAARSVTAKCLLDLGITSIVNATLELPTVAYQKQETIQIAVEDRVSSKLYVYFDLIADKIQHVELTGGKMLVYCRAGMSRSASLCIAYFMKYHGLSFDDAFMFVKDRRPIIHPNIGFLRQLRDYEQKLHSKPATVTRTPSFGKTAAECTPRIPLPSYAEDIAEEDILFQNAVEFPVKSTRPRRSKAKVVVSGPLDCVAQKSEVFPVSGCLPNDSATSSRLATERAGVNVADYGGVSVADVSNQTSLEQVGQFDAASRRSKRRTPFTKLTKPNELAVSYINIPLDLAFDNNSRKGFKLQINKEHPLSVISELLKVCSISEEVLHECIPEVSKAPVIHLGANKASRTIQMCSYATPEASQQTIWECVKLIEIRDNKQPQIEKPASLRKCSKTKKENDPKNVRLKNIPNEGRKTKTETNLYKLDNKKQATDVRPEISTSIRACIHNEGLLQQPLEKLDACALKSLTSLQNDKNVGTISVAIRASIPTEGLFVQAFENLDILSTNAQRSSMHLRQRLSISIIAYENALVTKWEEKALEFENLPGKYELIKKEYPYYSMIKYNKTTDLCRASKKEKPETNYNLVSKKVSNTPASVPLVRKKIGTPSSSNRKTSIAQICRQLEWSTERCLVDEPHYEKPKTFEREKLCYASQCWAKEHNTCSQYEPMIYYKLSLVGRFYVPHYNPMLLRRDPDVFWFGVAVVTEAMCFESIGLSKVSKLSTSGCVARAAVYEQWRGIATTSINDVRDCDDILENIPTVIFDINEMKDLARSNPKKCELWMNVFKRTLIQKSPTYAERSFMEALTTATTSLPTKLYNIDGVLDQIYPKEQVAQSIKDSYTLTPFALDNFELIIHEPYNDFSDICNINYSHESFVASETCVLINEYTINDLSMQMESSGYIPQNKEYNQITGTFNSFQSTSTVSFPNRIPTRMLETVFGTTKEYKTLGTFERYPFRIVTKLKEITDKSQVDILEASENLPNYEFVQDIEDQADVAVAIEPMKDTATLITVDAFWYFAIASDDKDVKLENNDSSDANFLLFLPDPEDMDRLGIESDVFPEKTDEVAPVIPNMDVVIPIIKEEIEAQVLEDKLATEVTEAKEPSPDLGTSPDMDLNFSLRSPRKHRGANDRKVNFDMDSSKMEMSKSTKPRVKTIYYGRDRSKSRHRLSDAQKESRDRERSKSRSRFLLPGAQKEQKDYPSKDNSKFREKFSSTDESEVLNNLSTSIASSSIILQKRREEGRSLSLSSGLQDDRNSRGSISSTRQDNFTKEDRNCESDGEPAGLMALLNVAQNWFGGKSRREQSKDRAKSLVKKCKRTN